MTLHFAAINCSLSQEATAESLQLSSDHSWHRITDYWLPEKKETWESSTAMAETGSS